MYISLLAYWLARLKSTLKVRSRLCDSVSPACSRSLEEIRLTLKELLLITNAGACHQHWCEKTVTDLSLVMDKYLFLFQTN